MTGMKSANFALLIVEPMKNEAGYANKDGWNDFLLRVERTLTHSKGIQCFHENVWLIPLSSELHTLCEIIQLCPARKVQSRVLLLEESPAWLKCPPDAISAG
jgi:hypothetical protein